MRPLYFMSIVIASVVLPWWLVLPLWVCYACVFRPYELIALGVLLDAYFGYAMPWHVFYTLNAAILFLVAEFLKPRVALYG